jgi:hypothetical protein
MTAATLTPARARLHATRKNLLLWTLQGWLAMFFAAAGYAKLTEPMTNLVTLMHWPALVSEGLVRGLGALESGLALAILVPLASWRFGRPVLLLATGALLLLEVVMLAVHALELDWGLALVNIALLAITAPVLLGRRHA